MKKILLFSSLLAISIANNSILEATRQNSRHDFQKEEKAGKKALRRRNVAERRIREHYEEMVLLERERIYQEIIRMEKEEQEERERILRENLDRAIEKVREYTADSRTAASQGVDEEDDEEIKAMTLKTFVDELKKRSARYASTPLRATSTSSSSSSSSSRTQSEPATKYFLPITELPKENAVSPKAKHSSKK